jgi:hypothetical protein
MPLRLSNEIEELVRLVASKTGQTPDDIINEAVKARALAVGVVVARPRRTAEDIEQRLKLIAERCQRHCPSLMTVAPTTSSVATPMAFRNDRRQHIGTHADYDRIDVRTVHYGD